MECKGDINAGISKILVVEIAIFHTVRERPGRSWEVCRGVDIPRVIGSSRN